jgi:hypothetical protein
MIWHACGVLTLADESEKHPQQPKVTAPPQCAQAPAEAYAWNAGDRNRLPAVATGVPELPLHTADAVQQYAPQETSVTGRVAELVARPSGGTKFRATLRWRTSSDPPLALAMPRVRTDHSGPLMTVVVLWHVLQRPQACRYDDIPSVAVHRGRWPNRWRLGRDRRQRCWRRSDGGGDHPAVDAGPAIVLFHGREPEAPRRPVALSD